MASLHLPPSALIVEDDPWARKAVVTALKGMGITPTEAASVGAAIMMLEQAPPTILILDLILPDANGVLLLRRIRRDKLPTRVAVVTGVPDPYTLPDMVTYPPDRLFRKPINLSQLVEWVTTP